MRRVIDFVFVGEHAPRLQALRHVRRSHFRVDDDQTIILARGFQHGGHRSGLKQVVVGEQPDVFAERQVRRLRVVLIDAAFFFEAHVTKARASCRETPDNLLRVVRGSTVHDDDLDFIRRLCHQALESFTDVSRAVQRGDADRQTERAHDLMNSIAITPSPGRSWSESKKV